jgi:hypothetical protein
MQHQPVDLAIPVIAMQALRVGHVRRVFDPLIAQQPTLLFGQLERAMPLELATAAVNLIPETKHERAADGVEHALGRREDVCHLVQDVDFAEFVVLGA